jgi:predicted RNA binding protein with dsRBD fold (UPF0201 family)
MEAQKSMIILVQAQINPTEDPEKVTKAIWNIFGDIPLSYDASQRILSGTITEIIGLKELRARIAQDRIRATIKNTLTRWMTDDYLSFGLNRQAAFADHVSLNLTNEDPMGPIQIQIKGDIKKVIEFLCT